MEVKDFLINILYRNIKSNGILIALSVCINLCALAIPIYTLQVYDRIITHQNFSTFIIVTLGALGFILLEFLFRICRGSLIAYYTNKSTHEEFGKAIKQFSKINPKKIENMDLSEKSNIINELAKTNDFFYRQLYVGLVDIIFLFFFLFVLSLLSFKLAMIITGSLIAFTVVAVKINSILIAKYKHRNKSDDTRAAGIIEFLRSIFIAKTHANESLLLQKHDVIERKSVINTYKLSFGVSFLYSFSTFTTQILVVITLIIGALQITHGSLTFGTLIATILIVGRLTNPIREMLTIRFRIANFVSSNKKIGDFYGNHTREYLGNNGKKNYRYILDIENLCIKESIKSNRFVIDSLNIQLSKGECAAITDINSHSRTLLKGVLIGAMKPDKGSILVLGNPLHKLTSEQYYRSIAYITMEEQYINGTILENITGGRNIPDEQIDELCEMLLIKDAIIQLDHGFQSVINSNTIQEISMNLREKILLARAYLKKPPLVILDTNEKYIDEDFYNTFFRFLNIIKRETAILIISNDLNITSLANRRIVVEDQYPEDYSYKAAVNLGAFK